MAISGGAQSTAQRLKSIVDYGATVLVCTPTYALHMASEARKAGMDLAKESAIRITIHAGEPGASIPSTKKMIEESWGAKCYDHAGATEVGAFGFECQTQPGAIHVNENEFIAEVIDPTPARPIERWRKRRIGDHQPRPDRQPRDSLPHRRSGSTRAPTLPLRPAVHCCCKVACLAGRMICLLSAASMFFPAPSKMLCENFPRSKNFAWKFLSGKRCSEIKLILEPSANQSSVGGWRNEFPTRARAHRSSPSGRIGCAGKLAPIRAQG